MYKIEVTWDFWTNIVEIDIDEIVTDRKPSGFLLEIIFPDTELLGYHNRMIGYRTYLKREKKREHSVVIITALRFVYIY